MICQKCGKCVALNHTYVFRFTGLLLPVDAIWITCKPCAESEYAYAIENFGEITKRSLKIYPAIKEED